MRALHKPRLSHTRKHVHEHVHRMRTSHKHGTSIFGKQKQFTLPNSKYEFVKDTSGKNYRVGTSKIADTWLDALGVKDRECVFKYFGKVYIADGVDYNKHIVYDYLGNRWHGAHNVFPINRDIPIKQIGKTPNQLYNETIARFKAYNALGFKVVFVWESDHKKGYMGRYYMGGNDNLY